MEIASKLVSRICDFLNADMYYGQCMTATGSSCSPTEDNCTEC